ncbi:GNAT family N-acetyltransferase [Streptococcus sp. 5346]|uniref:GNAT family N-acetyltransferase n=1 Tax=Streptococcus sp. 5346 TaxID=2582636 RepID=UPI00156419EE|nr:GNAT family N-acetyltransferase [Streptococcus sp. 5346]
MITIRKQEIVKLEGVLHLYQSVGWTNYTHQPEMLEQALSHSLVIYLALDGDAVVGLIRLVGDGFSSVLVQDLIVLPSYQRQGIGRSLMKEALEDYKDAYQVQLVTEQTEKNLGFYRFMGFEILSTYDCTGMIWINREK